MTINEAIQAFLVAATALDNSDIARADAKVKFDGAQVALDAAVTANSAAISSYNAAADALSAAVLGSKRQP